MSETFPIGTVSVPIVLRLQGNGYIKTDQLAPVRDGGVLYKSAAVAFNFMWSEADKVGVNLNNWGTYRPYDKQLQMFLSRYSETPTGRDPVITARWQGRTWWLRKDVPPVAVAGQSNHGWGMAIDVNYYGDRLEWMRERAPLYGFKWEVGPDSKYWEPWHLIYTQGSGYTLWVSNLIKQYFPK